MHNPHLLSALNDAHIDDLRRSGAASGPYRSRPVVNRFDRSPRAPRSNPRAYSVRALAARFAH
jgi:hypothetical protein